MRMLELQHHLFAWWEEGPPTSDHEVYRQIALRGDALEAKAQTKGAQSVATKQIILPGLERRDISTYLH
jgi:hypothetical protein